MAPRLVTGNLSYGYAATPNTGNVCGRCYRLQFTGSSFNNPGDPGSKLLGGKEMIVQLTNVGNDLESGQFDLLIPGGGVGQFNACSQQLGTSDLGARYGGFRTSCNGGDLAQIKSCVRDRCKTVFEGPDPSRPRFPDLLSGCLWYVDWLEAADNPSFRYQVIECPVDIETRSGALGAAQGSCF